MQIAKNRLLIFGQIFYLYKTNNWVYTIFFSHLGIPKLRVGPPCLLTWGGLKKCISLKTGYGWSRNDQILFMIYEQHHIWRKREEKICCNVIINIKQEKYLLIYLQFFIITPNPRWWSQVRMISHVFLHSIGKWTNTIFLEDPVY